ncbi:MAG: peptidylprolyl isomerase [Spirochaetales bacterium]|nr:peptidylprolyl isomerase [Spirochaetales bacterium]MCF7938311.1 peptidylprolyl isomerase [Spirochaetales bacterium]
MVIEKNKVVSIDYTVKDDNGEVIDTSEGREPLSFLFGTGSIIPGLEKELDGKEEGESVSVTVTPEEGYGTYDERLLVDVPKTSFQNPDQIQAGMQVQAQNQDGSTQVLTIKDIGEESVKLDGNHPLAGMVLSFDVDIANVREPSSEELEHGHVHDGNGQEHAE